MPKSVRVNKTKSDRDTKPALDTYVSIRFYSEYLRSDLADTVVSVATDPMSICHRNDVALT